MTENNILDGPRLFQVMVVDQTLAGITDPTERERYMALNVIQPSTVTISIEDNDGGCVCTQVCYSVLDCLYCSSGPLMIGGWTIIDCLI